MAAGAIVIGAIKIYIRHYLLVIDMMEFEVFTIPLMDDKISARVYTSTVQDGFPLQQKTQHVYCRTVRHSVFHPTCLRQTDKTAVTLP